MHTSVMFKNFHNS